MGTKIIQDGTLTDIADAIRAKTGKSATMTPLEMPTEIASISGGTEITDGIVVKARDESGRITEVDYYGTTIYPYTFGTNSNITTQQVFRYLEKINTKDEINTIKTNAFAYSSSSLTDFSIPNTVTIIERAAFYSCGAPLNIVIPQSVTSMGGQTFDTARIVSFTDAYLNAQQAYGVHPNGDTEILRGCRYLVTAQFGSVGYPCTTISKYVFKNCTQTGFTITAYCRGDFVDTLVGNLRYGATNATIIIKASEETTYNGTTYNAGDTILTSEVA